MKIKKDPVRKIFFQQYHGPLWKLVKDGEDIGYTSEKIIQDAVNLIFSNENETIKEKIGPKIVEFFKSGTIIPIYNNRMTFTDIQSDFWKKLMNKQTKVLAYYDPETNAISLLLSNLRSPFDGGITSEALSRLLIHEIVHFCAKNNFDNFIRIFQPKVESFYQTFFTKIYGTDLYEEVSKDHMFKAFIKIMVKCVFTNEKNLSGGKLISYPDILEQLIKYIHGRTLKDIKKTKTMLVINGLIKHMLFNYDKIGSNKQYIDNYSPVHIGLYKTYEELFPKKDIYTFPYQELLAPSEIISISSEYDLNEDIFELINTTELSKKKK